MAVRVECDGCGNVTDTINCARCVEIATEEVVVDCGHCDSPAEVCGACAASSLAASVREYADRRKMLGLMSPEVFAEFELFIDELEARA